MNKKILLATITVFVLFAGCRNATPTNTIQHTIKNATTITATPSTTITTSDSIEYNQYLNKAWVEKTGTSNVSFYISKIVKGEITGRFSVYMPAVPNHVLGNLTGTINRDKAECQFSDANENKGTITLVFKPNDKIEATINLTEKSQCRLSRTSREGRYQGVNGRQRPSNGQQPYRERYFRSLKYECIYLNEFEDPRALRKGVARLDNHTILDSKSIPAD